MQHKEAAEKFRDVFQQRQQVLQTSAATDTGTMDESGL